MPLVPNVAQRRLQPELIDQPDLDSWRHVQALRGLERINFFSRSAGILWPPIRGLALETGVRRLTLLDIGTGAGDLPVALWRKARRAGIELAIEACDISSRAIDYACRRARRAGAPVRFFQCNALDGDLPGGFDVVTSSLFLHHLDEAAAVRLLARMAASARRMVLVNDLLRSRAGAVLAYLATRILTTCDVVHVDGPRSVEGAFSLDEVRGLCRRARLEHVTLRRRWPCRYLLTWKRAGQPEASP
ncbi:MAG: methyltransferase domain-containing protein [Pirellulales bacterium]